MAPNLYAQASIALGTALSQVLIKTVGLRLGHSGSLGGSREGWRYALCAYSTWDAYRAGAIIAVFGDGYAQIPLMISESN